MTWDSTSAKVWTSSINYLVRLALTGVWEGATPIEHSASRPVTSKEGCGRFYYAQGHRNSVTARECHTGTQQGPEAHSRGLAG